MLKVAQNRLNKQFTAWQEIVHQEKDNLRSSSTLNIEQYRLKNNSLCAKMLEVKKLYSQSALSKFPAVFFPHLIFRSDSISTAIGRRLGMLQREGKIMCFNLPTCGPSKAIVFSKDLLLWHKQFSSSSTKIERFIKHVVPRLSGLRVQKAELSNLKLTERDICDLIRAGFLVYVAESTYELTIPCAGEYSKIFMEGRNAIVVALNKSPDKELLKSELRDKEFVKKRMFLGLDYHIADIIGLRIADSIETTEGQLIRYSNLQFMS